MPSYETLDSIADAYTPLLAILSLAFIVLPLLQSRWRVAAMRLLTFALLLVTAYGFMFLDARLNVWASFGLDYSTHTAVALVLVVFLSIIKSRLAALWLSSLMAYVLLMLYQRYHTISDIAATIAVVIVPAWTMVAFLYRRWPFERATISLDPDVPPVS